MDRKLFLHLGAHKTATTLVQVRLRERRRWLRRLGVYPVEARALLRSPLERYVAGDGKASIEEAARCLDGIVGGAPECPTVIVVFEDLLGRIDLGRLYPSAGVRMLRLVDCLRASENTWQLMPTLVVRRFDSYWLSCYRHCVKMGAAPDFHAAMERLEGVEGAWAPVVSAVEGALGRIIPVRCYEDLSELSNERFVAAVLALGGITSPAASEHFTSGLRRKLIAALSASRRLMSAKPNASLSERGVLLAESIRPFVTDDEWRNLFRPVLTRHFNRFLEPDSGFLALPDGLRERFAATYRADREWFGHRLELHY